MSALYDALQEMVDELQSYEQFGPVEQRAFDQARAALAAAEASSALNVYDRFTEEVDALVIAGGDSAVKVVGDLTRAVKRAQMVHDGELEPVAQRVFGRPRVWSPLSDSCPLPRNGMDEMEHERDLLRDVALRIWTEVQPDLKHRELFVDLGFVLSMTGDRELTKVATEGPEQAQK